tara:strand:- start:41 stop:3160 length:3120 start_codon:yes stop_codon:yes gene_type:complete
MKYDIIIEKGQPPIRVEADSPEDAVKIIKAEFAKKEASPIFDNVYFDYEKGLKNFKLRSLLGLGERSKAGKEIEKEKLLTNYVGSAGFTYNTRGDLAITPDGQRSLLDQGLYDEADLTDKNVIIDETGFASGDFADFSGIAGPIFGAIAAMSPHLRGVKLLTSFVKSPRIARIIAGGLGTSAGKGAEETLEAKGKFGELQEGFQLQEDQEIKDLLKREFYFGSAGQAVGELIGVGYGAFFGRKAPIKQTRDAYVVSKSINLDDVLRLDEKLGKIASEKDIAKALKKGEVKLLTDEQGNLVRGAVSQMFLGRAIPGRMQGIGETIAGKQGRERGLINYNKAMEALLREKMTARRVAAKELSDFQGTGAASSEIKIARKKLENTDNEISEYLNKMMLDLSAETGGFGPIMEAMDSAALGQSVQFTIKNAYKTMQDSFEQQYGKAWKDIDLYTGTLRGNLGKNVTEEAQKAVTQDLKSLQKFINETLDIDDSTLQYLGADGITFLKGLSKQIQDGAFAGGATMRQLIKVKSNLNNVKLNNQLDGTAGEFFEQVVQRVDDLIYKMPERTRIAISKIESRDITPIEKKELLEKIGELKRINKQYAIDHQPFNNAVVKKIKSFTEYDGVFTGAVNHNDVYNHIVRANKAGDLEDILSALTKGPGGTEKSEALRAELTRRIFKDALPLKGEVFNAGTFVGKILSKGTTLRPLLGKNYEQTMRTLQEFVKYNPKLKPDDIRKLIDDSVKLDLKKDFGPNFNKFIEGLESKAKASDELLKFEQARILTNVENATPETIAQVVFRPNSGAAINRVKKEVTEDAFLNIQDEALEQLIKKGIRPGGSDISEIYQPGNFQRALDQYGDETLEAMFGKDLKMALKGFARAMNVTVAGSEKTGAGSIVAGTLAAGFFNLNLLPTVATLTVYKTLFANPRIVSMLSRTDRTAVGEVVDAVEKAIRIGGFVEVGQNTAEGIQDVDRLIQDSGIKEQVKEKTNQIKIPTNLNLPNVQSILPNSNTSTVPVSRSLLGGSSANEDIANRRQGQGIAGLV